MAQFLINTGRYGEKLPHLPALEGDLKDPLIGVIRQRFDLGIEDLNPPRCDRRDKVRTVLNLLLAFLTKNHRHSTLA